MSLRFTASKDGKLRADVVTKYRIGEWELSCGVLRFIEERPGISDEWIDSLTKARVEKLLRDVLEERGYLAFEAADDRVSVETVDRVRNAVCILFDLTKED